MVGRRRRSAMVCARWIFSGVRGHQAPEATVLSLAMTMHQRPSTRTKAVTTPAAGDLGALGAQPVLQQRDGGAVLGEHGLVDGARPWISDRTQRDVRHVRPL